MGSVIHQTSVTWAGARPPPTPTHSAWAGGLAGTGVPGNLPRVRAVSANAPEQGFPLPSARLCCKYHYGSDAGTLAPATARSGVCLLCGAES